MTPAPEFKLSNINNPATNIPADNTISGIINGLGIVNIGFFLVGMIFMASLIMAATSYITASGSPDAIAKANTRLINSLLGLAVVFGSFIIVRLVLATIGAGSITIF